MHRIWPDPSVDVGDDVDALVAAEERPAPAGRPWVAVSMVASLDGATAIAGRSGPLGGAADRAMFLALRGIADVVLAGAGTVRAEAYGPPRASSALRAARVARGQAPVPRLAVVTASLDLDLSTPLFTDAAEPPCILTCDASPRDRRRAAARVAEVVVAGDRWVDLGAAVGHLGDRGAAVVLAEGGPQLNGGLVGSDLVDEWCLTLAPLLAGGDSDRLAVGPPVADPRALRLDRVWSADGLLLARHVRG